MQIILLRLPQLTTNHELEKLVHSVLAKKFTLPFTDPPEITCCKIIRMEDQQGIVEHHGLITVKPSKAGDWLIKHLNKEKLHKKNIHAKEYILRDSSGPEVSAEDERRRPKVDSSKIKDIKTVTNGLSDFAQEHKG